MLWGMLVGDPSAGKSPALDVITTPLSEIERTLADTFDKTSRDWEAKNQIAKIVAAEWADSANSVEKVFLDRGPIR
ncbi:hypothetical protein IMCC12053_1385 [Celeribacter marinus]|uniref:Uncharacterized protein n=1 Tax=Celeribacter marinus TaxID=1397108 RepID=A0A0P0A9L4_9RHOB|nr:hypothetical protein IMCC12053_1385 [Celeribacter marinus]